MSHTSFHKWENVSFKVSVIDFSYNKIRQARAQNLLSNKLLPTSKLSSVTCLQSFVHVCHE